MSRYDSMDPISRQDKDREAETAQYAAECRDEYAAARSRCGTCDQCGGHDGMRAFDREAVQWFVWGAGGVFWCWSPDKHHLYRPCADCNPGRQVLAEYEPMTYLQAVTWLSMPCDCTACLLDRGEIPMGGMA